VRQQALPALLLAAVAVVAACARRVPPPASPADVSWAQRTWPTASAEDLEHGRRLVQSKCGGACHRPPMPLDQPASEWPRHIAEMSVRAGLTPETERLVEMYLVTLARPADSAVATDP
jgi:cytochrome c5